MVRILKKSKPYKRMLLEKGPVQEKWNWQTWEKKHGPISDTVSYNSSISEVDSELESEEERKDAKPIPKSKQRVSFRQTRSMSGSKKYRSKSYDKE